ncbi:histamine receptor H2a [Platichthys flesus]|uniref:histamine receptor H2a n=1 Tax=Platichthys flesus TaxID=8260 RepID=UPI002DBC46FB|nr:histamine receptor H2a [Platichthys flesus]XP_062250091.1 histamine receptor H2a [Platichthys flesus]
MWSKVVLGITLSLLILLTVSGNVLVCLAVCASRRLRSLTNCFIVSLAVTDLLLGVLVLPFSALLQLNDEWPLGPVLCNFYISMDVMLCTASILTLLAISVDRYLAVTMPLRHASLVLPWRVGVAMASVWTVSVAVSFLPIHMGWNTVNGTVQNRGPWAAENKCRFELNRPYALTDSLLTFFLPLVAMCWTYLQILRIARAQAKRIISARPTWITHYNSRNNSSSSSTVVSSVTAVALREHKATVTLAVVIGAFVVCWLPYFILFTVLGLKEHPDPSSVSAYSPVLWLGYTNSALNPILYGALNRDFRSAYAHLLRCRCPIYSGWRSRQPSPTITAGREQLTEVTLLCGHTPSACGAVLTDQSFMLQEMNSRTNTATIQIANGTTATDVNGKERSC